MDTVEASAARNHRLRAHHLDGRVLLGRVEEVVGACGVQNSPPGAWETALWNRVENCTLGAIREALYERKSLLQAWSYRGAPVVFPTDQSDVFLGTLIARAGEDPWIYTSGITGALDHLQMPFDDLFNRTKAAVGYLDGHTVRSKEALDATIAELIERDLPSDRKARWRDPSMYGDPERQTVGQAAVSFLLRPCSFSSLVVFGERQESSPTFTSFENWIGHAPDRIPDADRELVRRFVHCYGPTTLDSLRAWLGSSRKQARRLWEAASEEMESVRFEGKTCFALSSDRESLLDASDCTARLLLLGAHDPYLDLRDRNVILQDRSLQKLVWKYVGNPGAILDGGKVVGIWKTKAIKGKIDVSMTLWDDTPHVKRKQLVALAEQYAAFRSLELRNFQLG